jgi:hypothetical protein
VKKTLLGVVGTVLVFWLTTALYDWIKGKQTDPKQVDPSGQTYYFDGQVVDETNKSLLSGVDVKLTISDTTTIDRTDSEGKYLFNVPKSGHQLAALFVASAAGYTDYVKNLKSDSVGVLESVPTVFMHAAPPQSGQNSPTAPVPKLTGKWSVAMKYTPRPLLTAKRIPIPVVKPQQ